MEVKRQGIIPLIIAISLICGCSGSGSPTLPDSSQNPATQYLPGIEPGPGRVQWGLYSVSLNDDHTSADVVPLRTSDMHLNTTRWVNGFCGDCLELSDFKSSYPDNLFFDLTLRHPFPNNIKFTGFDVRAIFLTDGNYHLNPINRSFGWYEPVLRLVNFDGYSTLFNSTDYPKSDPVPQRLKYIPNAYGYSKGFSANLNPFVAFGKGVERRMFAGETEETSGIHMKLPPGPTKFGLAIDACWQLVAGEVIDPIEDFPYDANCLEAYQISVELDTFLTETQGSSANLTVEVFDHQGFNTISGVYFGAPDLFTGASMMTFLSSGGDESWLYTGTVTNDLGAAHGEYPLIVGVIDIEEDENLGPILAWNVIPFMVTGTGDLSPVALAAVTPLEQEVGEPVHFVDNGSYDPDGGSLVSHEWDWNNDGVYDSAGTQMSITWTEPGIYPVQYRVTDDEGLTDTLDEPISIKVDGSPLHPVDVTPPGFSFFGWDIDVQGDHAYVAADTEGLKIFNIETPESATLVGDYPVGKAKQVDVEGNLAYIYSEPKGLEIVDISDPSAVSHVLLLEQVWFKSMTYDNGYIYGSGSNRPLTVIDVDPVESTHVAWLSTGLGYGLGVQVLGDLCYVADWAEYYHGLRVFDISDPVSTWQISHMDTSSQLRDVGVSGDFAYVLCDAGMQVINVKIQQAILTWGIFEDHGGSPWEMDIVVSGDYAYVTDRHNGLRIIDIDPPHLAHEVAFVPLPGQPDGIVIQNNYAYLSDWEDGFRIIRLW